ncbi:MAG TPA: PIN domain-containing protein [Dehalococcoidia bacterium]|nr:PIN domain-containing protein [Dehalococcoidia bacterium]
MPDDQFIDTNIIVRPIAAGSADHGARAQRFLRHLARGTEAVELLEAILVEAVNVLSSPAVYGLPRGTIRDYLSNVIAFPGVQIPHKASCIRALELWAASRLDFPDALLIAHMERTGASTVVSFDRDFDRIPGITRREP